MAKLSIGPKKLIRISSSKSSIILNTDSLFNKLINGNKIKTENDKGEFEMT
ncbi:MAG: hypothetical protein H7098_08050, partial [Oligoflexus sp.]|nr:hypothetical protein [Pseudopedobacter sp.]